MEMRQKRMSVYKTMMRRRAFTNWANILLRSLDKQIVDIFNPNECALLEALLEIALKKSEKKFRDFSGERKKIERESILKKAEHFQKNYFKSDQGQDVNRETVIQFIWDLIEFFHISSGKELWDIENTPMNAKEILLKWLNSKLRGRKVRNFTTDWNDGTVLCDLINALEPGLIPARVYLQGSWTERNVRVAMETVEKEWGIPMIISPDDMTSSEVDELSIMTYVALIFEYDLERSSANQNSRLNNGHFENKQENAIKEKSLNSEKVKENIKRKPETGRVGKEIEYRLDLHDVNANEITVSIEFKPAEKLTQDYKPDLRVFSMGKGRFRVKYTPNLAGNYKLSMFYKDEHIADTPYCVQVLPIREQENGRREKENGRIDLQNNNGKSHIKGNILSGGDKIESEDLLAKDGFYGFDGEGLKHATVGKLAVFTVITDNRDKGPLSVCINCPAVSLPIPHVKTTSSKNYSTHTVGYMPTLAGTYKIFIRWGLKLINGSPFEVQVRDHDSGQATEPKTRESLSKKRTSSQFSHIKVYYSSTSLDSNVIRDTEQLERLLQGYGLTKSSSDDIWVSIDLELQKDERDLIFRLAGTRRLPLLFIHEQCLGSFEDVCELHKRNELEERLMYKIRKV